MEQCSLCEQPLAGRHICQLVCGHTYHTQCLMEDQTGFFCETCGDAHEDEVEDQHETQAGVRARSLWETNEQFRKDIKAFQKVKADLSKPKKAYQELVAQKKAEVAPRWALLKAQYEGLYNTKEDEILESEQYKAYKRAYTRLTHAYTKLRTRYEIRSWDFSSLRTLPGCKRLSYAPWLTPRPQSLLWRALRLRLGGRYRRW
jgi:hypothetical protein